jgi:hypothetical protein
MFVSNLHTECGKFKNNPQHVEAARIFQQPRHGALLPDKNTPCRERKSGGGGRIIQHSHM